MSDYQLIETMRFEPETGIARARLHLARLKRSARRLGFAGSERAADALHEALATKTDLLRVRLTLARDGAIDITTAPFTPLPADTVWTLRIAATTLSSQDGLLRYKTSRRQVYEKARAEYAPAQADEVLLLNEKGEPCEGTITSVFLDDGSGILKTPPIACGLLAGVLRNELICKRQARVERLSLERLHTGTLYVGNSLRGLIRARLAP